MSRIRYAFTVLLLSLIFVFSDYIDGLADQTESIGTETVILIDRPVLSNVSSTASGVTVKWSRINGANKYYVYHKGPKDNDWVKVKEVTGITATDTTVVSGNKYSFRVCCADSSGRICSKYSKYMSVFYLARPVLKSVASTASGVTVKWNRVPGASGYRVFRKDAENPSWKAVADTHALNYTDQTANSGVRYTYTLRSLDDEGKLRNTNSKTMSLTYIARPVMASVSSGPDGAVISWKPVSGASKYRVYRKGPDDIEWKKVGDSAELSLVDQTAESGTKYTYSVRSFNGEGKLRNTYSSTMSLNYIARPVITETENTDNGILLSWDAVGGAGAYRVYKRKLGTDLWNKLTTTDQTSVTDANVVSGESYEYTVKSIDTSGNLKNTYAEKTQILCQMKETVVYSKVSSLTLHTAKDDTSEAIFVPYMTKMILLDNQIDDSVGKWISVRYENKVWYTWKKAGRTLFSETESPRTYQTANQYQQEVIDLALSYLDVQTGYRYTSEGGSTGVPDENGVYWFDCSGFTSYCINTVMQKHVPVYEISVDVDNQFNTGCLLNTGRHGEFSATTVIPAGEKLNTELLMPGDLLFYKHKDEPDRAVDHVALYLGNNEIIHATQTYGIERAPLEDAYVSDFVSAIRVIPDSITDLNSLMYTVGTAKLYSTKSCETAPLRIVDAHEAVTAHFTDGNNWTYVNYDGQDGFMYLEYLSDEAPEEICENRYIVNLSQNLYPKRSSTVSDEHITLYIGDEVIYRGRYASTDYYRVSYEDQDYYIYCQEDIDQKISPDLEAVMSIKENKYLVTSAWMRSAMDSKDDSNKLRLLARDEAVGVIGVGTNGNWTYIQTSDGERGYILSEKLYIPEQNGDENL